MPSRTWNNEGPISPMRGIKQASPTGQNHTAFLFRPEDTIMLKGFSLPLSPHGQSPLAQAPRHCSSDCLAIEFWTDPAAIAALLTHGRAPDAKFNRRALSWFLDRQRSYVLPTSTWSVWTTADEIMQVGSNSVH